MLKYIKYIFIENDFDNKFEYDYVYNIFIKYEFILINTTSSYSIYEKCIF
jgi:hypothetical protein